MHTPLSRRRFLHQASVSALSVGALSSCGIPRSKPNVILIMADDLGYECLGCYGGTSYRTPNLDELAHTGIRFNHAYAQPLCTPTRLQLMTGQYNFRNWKAFGIMDPKETTFGHIMQQAGYKTCIAGKWQFWSYNPPDFEPEWRGKGMRAEDAGFDEYCLWHTEHMETKGSRYFNPTIQQNGQYLTGLENAYGPDIFCNFVCDFAERHRNDPFFIYYPMALTHNPFESTPHSPDWNENRGKQDAKYFGDMVEYMDYLVGRIVKKLDDLGIRENTLLLFYSDNGTNWTLTSHMSDIAVKGGKGEPTDAGTRVPLIASWPGITPEGRVLDDLIDSTDFLPTIAELGRAAIPANMPIDGRSFLPQLQGARGNPREWVFCHHDPRPGWDKERFKLERWARDQRWKLYEDGRLYDVPADVLEQHPLADGEGGSEASVARKKLRAVLDRMK